MSGTCAEAKMSAQKVPDDILAILGRCRIEGTTLYLPDEQLERSVYLAVNKILENIGGKWNRKAKGHVFEEDPTGLLDRVLMTGETVDLKKAYQFFPTPRPVAEMMCRMAELDQNSVVLEPSCGKGDLADIVYETGVKALVGVELSPEMSKTLREKPYLVMMETDFLKFAADPSNGGKWTHIVMNPPFTRQQDIDHILAAYNLLAPGGILVSVVSESPFFWANQKASDFRDLLEQNNAEVTKLDEGAFKESGTMVRSRIIKMRKAAASAVNEQTEAETPVPDANTAPESKSVGVQPGNIINLPVASIFPHPDNPRRELGDLTELADSIRANGIMQNLTVIPRRDTGTGFWDGKTYTVLIGHRRLAASKLAGLEEVPCAIAEMSEAEQVRTMLMENMQRSDLTIFEQAQGFQMMLDMGGTVQSVSEDIGLSEKTVRQRVSLLKLNPEKFKASEERGATLSDYLALDKLEAQDLKDRVLDAIGTKNFDSVLDRAKKEQRRRKKLRKIADAMAKFATERANDGGLVTVKCYYDDQTVESIKPPKDSDTTTYFFVVNDYNVILCRKKTAQDDEAAAAKVKEDADKKALTQQREEAFGRARALRTKFVEEFPNARAKAHLSQIVSCLLRSMATGYINGNRTPLVLLGLMKDQFDPIPSQADILAGIESISERSVLIAAYTCLGDGIGCKCCDWAGNYRPNDKLTAIYDFLTSMGYEMSDEEQALLDGTSSLYVKQSEVA